MTFTSTQNMKMTIACDVFVFKVSPDICVYILYLKQIVGIELKTKH
jgi:hypothetical protein